MAQLVGTNSLGLGKLIDGKHQFIHIRYSAKADGSNMTSEIQPDTKYIGIRTSTSETPSINPADYSWGRFVGTSGTSSYTWIRYSPNEDGSNMTATANEGTKYIGVAITSENSAPIDHTRYSWALFKGTDGRGIERTDVSYQKSTNGVVIPTGPWSTSIPSLNDGEYLWTRTLFTYTDGKTTSTFSVSRNGTAGLGISRTDVHYQKSRSGTTAPTGEWTVTIPNVGANEYLWTRTRITYTDGSTSVSYSVGKMGADGRDAQLLYLTASSQIQAFDENDEPKTTEPVIISAKLQNASGTATFVAIPYIGNTAQPTITLGGTGNDRTLLPSQWVSTKWTSIAITATLGPLTDTISVVKVKDGRTPVVHTAWADSEDGRVGFTLEKPAGKIPKYVGHYVDYSLEASTNPADYKWARNPDDVGNVADDANGKSDLANQLANAAKELANKANVDAAEANRLIGVVNTEIERLDTDVSNAKSDLADAEDYLNSKIETVKTTLTEEYATKTNLSETQITLNKTISESVASVKQEMSETYAVKTDFTELSGDYTSFKEDTAKKFSQQVSSIETVQADTAAAQQMVNAALSKAQSAITDATNASNLANNALGQASNATNTANSASQNAANAVASANNALNSANAAKDNAIKAIADVAALTKTVTTQGTKIDQTSSRIDLVANGVTEVGNKLDNLQVGGRNLARGTYGEYTAEETTNVTVSENFCVFNTKTYLDGLKVGDTVSYRCVIRYTDIVVEDSKNSYARIVIQGDGNVTGWNSGTFDGGSVATKQIKISGSGEVELKRQFTVTAAMIKNQYWRTNLRIDYVRSGKIERKCFKVEKGNKHTDWSPAPEDQQSQIDGINTNLSNNYYQKTTVDSKLSTAVSGITAQYTQDINTRLGNYYDKSTIDSKLTIDGKGIATYVKSTQSQLDNLQVGGRNLLKDTANFGNSGMPSGAKDGWLESSSATLESEKYNGLTVRSLKNATSELTMCQYRFTGFNLGDTYTLSFWAKGTIDRFSCYFYGEPGFVGAKVVNASIPYDSRSSFGDGMCVFTNSQIANWTRISITWQLDSKGDINIAKRVLIRTDRATSGDFYVCGVKLEKGNTPTDWSPAPEDMATLTQYTEVKQLADRISSTVYDSASGLITKTTQLAGKYAIQNLNSYGDVLSSLNLNGGNVRIKGTLIELDGYTKMAEAFINNLTANSIITRTIDARSATIANAAITNLNATNIKSGYLDAQRIKAGSITSDKISVTTLSAITANLGKVASGYIGNGKSYWDLETGNFFNTNEENSSVSIGNGKIIVSNKTSFDSSSASSSFWDSLELNTNYIALGNSSGYLEIRPNTIGIGGSSSSATILTSGGLRFGYDFNATVSWFQSTDRVKNWYDSTGYRLQSGRIDLSGGSINTNAWALQLTANTGPVNLQGESANIRNMQNTAYVSCYAANFSSQSAYSAKTDFENIDNITMLQAILKTDIVKYRFKNNPQKYVGFIINDNGDSPYMIDKLLVNDDNSSFSSNTAIGVAYGAIKELNRKLEKLEAENFLLQAKLEAIT